MNKLYLLPLNVARISFASLVAFDSFVSYWAVKYRGAKEMDLLIAPLVEKYPLSYFLLIPILLFIMYFVVNVVTHFAGKTKELSHVSAQLTKRLVLTSLVFYWAIGNSSLNLLYVLGLRQPPISWMYTTITAVIIVGTYIVFVIRKIQRFDGSNH